MTNDPAVDLALAIAHHILIFSFAGILAFEIAIIRTTMRREDIIRVARADAWYGLLAIAILAVGFSRAIFAAKGWTYYAHNGFFWAKLGAFALVGLLSIVPTLKMIRWRKRSVMEPAFTPPVQEIGSVKRFLRLEVAALTLVLAFAATMARGYGSL